MSSRVFISHSSQDKDIADAALSYLESNGLKCWLAPRDISPGSDWAEAIIDGIDSSSGLLLILSQHSNQSPQVRRELERAVSRGITIYPLVVENLKPSKWMQYYISAHQWHDATETSLSKAMVKLLEAIQSDQTDDETEADFSGLSALLEDDLGKLSSMLDDSDEEVVLLTPGERRRAAVLHISYSLNSASLPSSIRKTISKTVQNLIEKYTSSYGAHLDITSPSEHRGIFGLEKAVENDVSRALTCGIQLFNGFSELNSVLRKKDLSIEFGLGVSTGTLEVVKTSSESIDFQGGFLSKAKNLAESASNELIASSAVYKLSKDNFTWEEHGEGSYRISDYSLSVPESRVLTVRSPFVGREEELSRLRSVLNQQEAGTEKNRRGGAKHLVMGISGDAGIGKSRLVHEFIENECTGDEYVVLKGQTLSYAQPSYWLWTTLLRNLLNIEHGSGLSYEEFTKRLRDYTTDEELLNSAPFLSELLSIKSGDKRLEELDNKAIVLETKIAFRNLLKVLSDKHRLVVVLEDIHWIGESSKAVLEFVLGNCDSETAVVFLLVYRPENEDGRSVEFEIHSNYAITDEVRVEEVSDTASEELIDKLLSSIGNAASPLEVNNEVKSFLLERSKGNPFYLEELVLDLVEKNILVQTDQQWQFDRQPEEIHVPDSLTGLLQSRLDRLPESWREVLQNSSVLGMEFQLKLYTKMVNKLLLGRPRSETFQGLERKQMLLSEISAFEKKYLFRHALVHDTAYSSILEENLKQLHKSAAESIEEFFAEERDQVASLVMHHYERAGETTKAIVWGMKALEHSAKSYCNEEALALSYRLEHFLVSIPDSIEQDELLFKVLCKRERSLNILGKREQQKTTLQQIISTAEKTQNHDHLASALRVSGEYARITGCMNEAIVYYEKSLNACRLAGDDLSEGKALVNMGALFSQQGKLDKAQEYYMQSLKIFRRFDGCHHEASVFSNLGILYSIQGRMDEAIQNYERAIDLCKLSGNRLQVGVILGNLGLLYSNHRSYDAAKIHYDKALTIHKEVGNRRLEGMTLGNLGTLSFSQRRVEEASDFYEEALDIAREVGNRRSEGMTLSNIGELRLSQGLIEEAKTISEAALEIHREVANYRCAGITHGNLGLLYCALNRFDEACAHFKDALHIHREVGNLREEGVVLSNLGDLYQRTGQLDAAQSHLDMALEISRGVRDPLLESIVHVRLGILCNENESNMEARQHYMESLEIATRVDMAREDYCKELLTLRNRIITSGLSEDEVPWPSHWDPPQPVGCNLDEEY